MECPEIQEKYAELVKATRDSYLLNLNNKENESSYVSFLAQDNEAFEDIVAYIDEEIEDICTLIWAVSNIVTWLN